MARKPSVRYWPTRGAYMCTLHGRQHVLAVGPKDDLEGPTYALALKKFAELITLSGADTARDENAARTILELYCRHVEATLTPATLRFRLKYLRPFADALGDVRVRDLTRHQVNTWLTSMRRPRTTAAKQRAGWGDSSVGAAIGVITTGFRWAIAEGLITRNPIEGMRKPRSRSRGRESLIGHSAGEQAQNLTAILGAATKAFRPFIKVLAATGARPGEISAATAADFDPQLGAIHYHADETRRDSEYRHKNAGRGKERIILLVGEALQIVRELVAKYPHGPLFRTTKGKRWSGIEIIHRFVAISEKTGLHVTAYSFRHQYATNWLQAGKPIDALAALLGNTPEVLRLHYSHLLGDTANLRRLAEEFTAAQGTCSPSHPSSGAASDSAPPAA